MPADKKKCIVSLCFSAAIDRKKDFEISYYSLSIEMYQAVFLHCEIHSNDLN